MFDAADDVDRVRIGGLMRCCLETLEGLYPDGPGRVATEGQRLQCEHAEPGSDHGWMVFRDGWWAWDHD